MFYICVSSRRPPACAMASDSSDSEFEGVLPDDNQPTLNSFNKSDIDVSEVSSVSDHSSNGDDDVDDADDAGPIERQAQTTPVAITLFMQPTHLNHQLADDANPPAFFHGMAFYLNRVPSSQHRI